MKNKAQFLQLLAWFNRVAKTKVSWSLVETPTRFKLTICRVDIEDRDRYGYHFITQIYEPAKHNQEQLFKFILQALAEEEDLLNRISTHDPRIPTRLKSL